MPSRTDPAPRSASRPRLSSVLLGEGEGATGASAWLRVAGFVLASTVAYLIDLFLTMAPPDERVGHHWLAFGVWDISLSTYALALALVYGVLLLRRQWPMSVLIFMTVVTLLLTFVSQLAQPLAGMLLALYAAAAMVEHVWASRLALLLGLLVLVGPIPLHAEHGIRVSLSMGIVAAATVGVWLVGRHAHRSMHETAGLRGELENLQERAAAEERARIARELHDILAHSVSAMMMQAAGARAVVRAVARDAGEGAGPGGPDGRDGRDGRDPKTATASDKGGGPATPGPDPRWATVEQALATIEATGSQSMRELQRLLGALREDSPPADEVRAAQPGLSSLEELVRITRSSGIAVEIQRSGKQVPVDWSVGLAGYRVVQESLANAMKHAGRGAAVQVLESWGPRELRLQVRCRPGRDSQRPDVHGGGSGLVGLRQRVALVGGRFDAAWVGEEYVTTADLPLTGTASGPRSAPRSGPPRGPRSRDTSGASSESASEPASGAGSKPASGAGSKPASGNHPHRRTTTGAGT